MKVDANQRIVITKENNPIATLVTVEDFRQIEQREMQEQGLASLMGKWEDFDEIGEILADIPSMREKGGFGRDVSF